MYTHHLCLRARAKKESIDAIWKESKTTRFPHISNKKYLCKLLARRRAANHAFGMSVSVLGMWRGFGQLVGLDFASESFEHTIYAFDGKTHTHTDLNGEDLQQFVFLIIHYNRFVYNF